MKLAGARNPDRPARRPPGVPCIARWHWDEWRRIDPECSLETWTAGLAERAQRTESAGTWVAVLDERPVGSVALVAHDMATRWI
jgi:hypothetical protein